MAIRPSKHVSLALVRKDAESFRDALLQRYGERIATRTEWSYARGWYCFRVPLFPDQSAPALGMPQRTEGGFTVGRIRRRVLREAEQVVREMP